ncbi:hypothetical protein Lal_00014983 [Lupinus albus]|nr:hypothetical protein Lal_00014983 [Lupinus albus]
MDTLIDHFGVEVIHAWGMTEMSPLGTTCSLLARHRDLPVADQRAVLRKQGHAIYGVDMKIVDDAGNELPWDGRTRRRAARRLVPDRRRGHDRCGRLPADHGPQQGRHQVRRRVDRVDRPREHRDGPSGRAAGRVHRRAASEVGRASRARRRAAAGSAGHARRAAALLRRQGGEVLDAGRRAVRGRAADRGDRQDPEEPLARTVQRLPAARLVATTTTPCKETHERRLPGHRRRRRHHAEQPARQRPRPRDPQRRRRGTGPRGPGPGRQGHRHHRRRQGIFRRRRHPRIQFAEGAHGTDAAHADPHGREFGETRRGRDPHGVHGRRPGAGAGRPLPRGAAGRADRAAGSEARSAAGRRRHAAPAARAGSRDGIEHDRDGHPRPVGKAGRDAAVRRTAAGRVRPRRRCRRLRASRRGRASAAESPRPQRRASGRGSLPRRRPRAG